MGSPGQIFLGQLKIPPPVQVDEIISLESQQQLEEGKHPGPMTEIKFWEAKSINLESIFEQVGSNQILTGLMSNKMYSR